MVGVVEDELRLLLLAVAPITLSILVLSAAGISAKMSFAVTQRQREIGIASRWGRAAAASSPRCSGSR